MLGAIVGDVAGSSYESCLLKFSDPSKITLFMATSRFTDDSVMTLAVARWLTDSRDKSAASLVEAMQKLGRKYPNAGYGPAFARWLAADNPKPYGSWGNGAAMRVSPAGLYATTLDEALRLAISLGGDADTQAAIAASMAAARWPVPDWMEQECRRRLTPELVAIIDSFEGAAADRAAGRATMQTRPGATH